MLGTIESTSSWHWAAYGKHPVANDYFRVGGDLPLVKRFSDWVENGYHMLSSRKNASSNPCSWRFWARGSQKENIACGVLRDSSDSLGRPYPFLIMGLGPLKNWEEDWDLLPFACERTWGQIEYLSALVANNLKRLEEEIHHIRPPHFEWSELAQKRKDLEDLCSNPNTDTTASYLTNRDKQLSNASDQADFIIPLDPDPVHNQFLQASLWHHLLKDHVKVAPNTIFMGGTLDKTYLAIFRRALTTTDFVQLWSLSSEDPSSSSFSRREEEQEKG